MREIKFRAWHKIDKLICPVQTLTDQGAFLLGLKPGKEQIIPEMRLIIPADPSGRFCNNQEIELMQYTGLKDKNGKEIYEGDWCEAKFRDREGIQAIQGQIIMDEYMWCIDCQGCVGDDIFSINRPHNFEIIGNIYENPELLNPAKEINT